MLQDIKMQEQITSVLAPSVLLLGKLQASSNKYNIMKANEVETIEPGKLRKVITPELRTLEPMQSEIYCLEKYLKTLTWQLMPHQIKW